jgi:hypothetical protein
VGVAGRDCGFAARHARPAGRAGRDNSLSGISDIRGGLDLYAFPSAYMRCVPPPSPAFFRFSVLVTALLSVLLQTWFRRHIYIYIYIYIYMYMYMYMYATLTHTHATHHAHIHTADHVHTGATHARARANVRREGNEKERK